MEILLIGLTVGFGIIFIPLIIIGYFITKLSKNGKFYYKKKRGV